MHELSLAEAMADQLKALCRAEGAVAVLSVTVRIGALSGVDEEAFAWAFPLAVQGTVAEGATLTIERIDAQARCEDGGHVYAPELGIGPCPVCGSPRTRILSGREFTIVRMDVRPLPI
jgi:hydrogenase nickel incorporation protein HypA/HybF